MKAEKKMKKKVLMDTVLHVSSVSKLKRVARYQKKDFLPCAISSGDQQRRFCPNVCPSFKIQALSKLLRNLSGTATLT